MRATICYWWNWIGACTYFRQGFTHMAVINDSVRLEAFDTARRNAA